MSSGDGGLGAMVLGWAKNKEERCEKWMDELKENDIEDMDALVKVAASPDWAEFLGILKIPLRTYMREWYERADDLKEVRARKRKFQESEQISTKYLKTELDILEEYRPLHIEGIQNFSNMLGQYLAVDNTDLLWSDSRKDLNTDGRVLITAGIIEFISMLKSNFVDHKPIWDGLLVRGMSGSGKSVAFALGAAYLNSLEKFDVYWIRSGEKYVVSISDILTRRISSISRKRRIIFVDQADKLENRLDTFIGSGSENDGVFTVGCASGNARVTPSTSRATRIREHLYDPSLNYELFKAFFNILDEEQDLALPEFLTTFQMLDHQVSDFPTLFVGTSGHFLSMAKFRKEFVSTNMDVKLTWDKLLLILAEEIHSVFAEERPDLSLFYSQLHKVIFLNSSLSPSFDQTYKPDNRFVHDGHLFSPLFTQAFRIMMLICPPSKTVCSSLRALKDAENPSVRGFCVERFVLDKSEKMEEISRIILARPDISFVDSSSVHKKSGTYGYAESLTIPEDMAIISNELRSWQLIPLKWNEKGVDAVLVFTIGAKASVIGVQITMESSVKHSSSLGWFRDNEFEKKLVKCGYQVSTILLFLCNVEAADLKTSFQEAEGKPVFDFPLYAIIPDVIDRKIVKSNATPMCRKLNVLIESAVYLDGHSAIEKATVDELRSFCMGFGHKKFKKKEEGRSLAFGIYHSLNPDCIACQMDLKKSGISHIIRLIKD
jgi:hypothetical protein